MPHIRSYSKFFLRKPKQKTGLELLSVMTVKIQGLFRINPRTWSKILINRTRKGVIKLNKPTSSLRSKTAGLCLAAMFATFLPAASAFWGSVTDGSSADAVRTAATGAAPKVEPVEGETYAGVMIELPLKATDPDGDPVLFKLVDAPRMGTAVIDQDKLQYTPQDGKTGTEKFTYAAVDTMGNTSEPAQIKIKITKNKAKMTYADMENSPAHYAALQLAQTGIVTGEKIGASYFLHPNTPVTRSEFIAMTSAAADLPIQETSQTDFVDDGGLSDWVKPYISAAAANGLVSGYLTASGTCEIRGENPITLAEASVIVNNLLSDSLHTSVQTAAVDSSFAPVWAQNACAVLTAAEVLPEQAMGKEGNTIITREAACEMLYRAMCVLEKA